MVWRFLWLCVLLLTLLGLYCRRRKQLATRLARIDRLKALTERLDTHSVLASQRAKLV